MSYSTILFDLDGTINESGPGIKASFRYVMERFGIPISDDIDIDFVVGPPLSFSFEKLGVDSQRIDEAIGLYREYYQKFGIFNAVLYDGIVDTIKQLNNLGKKVHIATSKPDVMSERILEHYKIRSLFGLIAGATMDEKRTKKEEVIAWALENLPMTSKSDILMIGDRYHDVLGAKANGIDCLGVLYGYGTEEELLSAGAKYIAKTPEDILKYV